MLALPGLYLLFAIKVVQQWEKVALLRLGRYVGLRGPGIFHIIPVVDTLSAFVDQRAPALVAQSEAHAYLPLQKGISVELPVTSNAVPLPEADQEDALIVTETDNGSVYFGIGLTTPAGLEEKVRGGLSNRTEKKLYIKVDARTPYASVVKVLEAVRTAGVETPELLTDQIDSSEPGALVSPKGLEVSVGPRLASRIGVCPRKTILREG